MLKKYIILILVLLTSSTGVFSSVNNDSITISLLTAEPGEKVYERFGHTAIRIRMGKDTDVVFNYGLFSFSSPNFLYRFVKGETDYQLGLTQFPYFNMDYALRGSKVYEQTLNIPQKDAINIFTALQENYLPHNKVYRYN